MTKSAAPFYWDDAQLHLAQQDVVLAQLIADYGHLPPLTSRGDPFETLMHSIVGQQISVKAAATIWGRVVDCVQITPACIDAVEVDVLRGCGVSHQKIKYMKGIASAFLEGRVHPHVWSDWVDDDIIAELVRLPGVGRWTAEMFLMFGLLRPDVLPVHDAGIRAAFERFYGQSAENLHPHAVCWQPYRTVACWYLWRGLNNAPTVY